MQKMLFKNSETYGVIISQSAYLTKHELIKQGLTIMTTTNTQKAAKKEKVKDEIITDMMLGVANGGCFKQVKVDHMSDDAKGNNTYPETSNALVSLMNALKTSTQQKGFPVLTSPQKV